KEVDRFPNTRALATIQGPFGSQRFALTGPTTVVVDIANVADRDRNGLEEVISEITSMDLHGTSIAGPVTIRIRDAATPPFKHSLGRIEEQRNATPRVLDLPPFAANGSAVSTFDVYFEVEIGGQIGRASCREGV